MSALEASAVDPDMRTNLTNTIPSNSGLSVHAGYQIQERSSVKEVSWPHCASSFPFRSGLPSQGILRQRRQKHLSPLRDASVLFRSPRINLVLFGERSVARHAYNRTMYERADVILYTPQALIRCISNANSLKKNQAIKAARPRCST